MNSKFGTTPIYKQGSVSSIGSSNTNTSRLNDLLSRADSGVSTLSNASARVQDNGEGSQQITVDTENGKTTCNCVSEDEDDFYFDSTASTPLQNYSNYGSSQENTVVQPRPVSEFYQDDSEDKYIVYQNPDGSYYAVADNDESETERPVRGTPNSEGTRWDFIDGGRKSKRRGTKKRKSKRRRTKRSKKSKKSRRSRRR